MIKSVEHSPEQGLLSGGRGFIKFESPTCGSCKMQDKILEQALGELEEVFTVVHVDVTKHPEIAATFNVTTLPQLVYIQANQQPVPLNPGVVGKLTIIEYAEKYKDTQR